MVGIKVGRELLDIGKQLLSGCIGGIPDGKQEYFELQSITLQSLLDEADKNTTELKESLREFIKETCGSLWSFRLAASLDSKNTWLYQPPYVLEHAKIINKTFNNFLGSVSKDSSKAAESLRVKVTSNNIKGITGPYEYDRLYDYTRLTSPIHSIKYLREEMYNSLDDFKKFMITGEQSGETYKREAIDYIGRLYHIETPGLSNQERIQFILKLISLNCFPSIHEQKGEWLGWREAIGVTDSPELRTEWFKETQSYKKFKSNLIKIYTSIDISSELGYVLTLEISKENNIRHLRYPIQQLPYIYYALGKQIKYDSMVIDMEEVGIQDENGERTQYITGLKLSDIFELDMLNNYTSTLHYFELMKCRTISDILNLLYNGKIKPDSIIFEYISSYKDILARLSLMGFEKLVSFKHTNTQQENTAKAKYEILGRGKDWLLNNATLNSEPFKSSLSDNDKRILIQDDEDDIEDFVISAILTLYNNGYYKTEQELKAAEKFKNIILKIGYSEVLKFDYNLYRLNI